MYFRTLEFPINFSPFTVRWNSISTWFSFGFPPVVLIQLDSALRLPPGEARTTARERLTVGGSRAARREGAASVAPPEVDRGFLPSLILPGARLPSRQLRSASLRPAAQWASRHRHFQWASRHRRPTVPTPCGGTGTLCPDLRVSARFGGGDAGYTEGVTDVAQTIRARNWESSIHSIWETLRTPPCAVSSHRLAVEAV